MHTTRTRKIPLLFCIVTSFALGLSTISGPSAFAETLYVKPSAEVVVRTGQGTDYKIVAMVKDGTTVELIEQDKSYMKIRLKNGIEGWMLGRFLSREKPLSEIVSELKKENEFLRKEKGKAVKRLKETAASLKQSQFQLQALLSDRDKLSTDYQRLLDDTADIIQIKKDQKITAEQNKQLREELNLALEENNRLKKDKTMYWFLIGAGVLLAGIIIGKMPGPSRRRKSSLM